MSDEKPTVQLDAVQVLSRLIEGVRTDVSRMRDEQRADSEETRKAVQGLRDDMGKLQTSERHLADEVSKLAISHGRLEERVGRLETDTLTNRRAVDSIGHETSQAVEGIKTHIAKVNVALVAFNQRFERVESNDEAQNKALESIGSGIKKLIRLANSPKASAYLFLGAVIGGALYAIAREVFR